jgi:hypothetical protein
VTSYQRFLGAVSTEVLPYFGGPFVDGVDRRLRLDGTIEPGYWRFEVRGRTARAIEPAEAPDLSGLPLVRGYTVDSYLVSAGGIAELLSIPPADEPLPFTPVLARRWPTGALLFDSYDFESGIEDTVREALEGNRTLAGVAGVPAALRAAFGYTILLRTARRLNIPARPAEARARLGELAAEGEPAARRLLVRAQRHRAAVAPLAAAAPAPRTRDTSAEDRVAAALDAARAALRGTRWLEGGRIEVRYDLDGERFVSIVDSGTLQIVDAGICLDGEDRQLTLDSLPGVIREAIATGELHITGW